MAAHYHLVHRGNWIPLGLGTALMGRAVGCKLRLDGDGVSRRHARLTVADQLLIVEDLESENGVFVNGERLDRPRRLVHGDRVMVGGHEMRVVVAADPDDGAEPPAPAPTPAPAPSPAPARVASGGGAIDRLWDDDDDQAIHKQGADTRSRDPQMMFCSAVLEELDAGQVEHAARVLSTILAPVIRDVARGGARSRQLAALAISGAARLARATGEARWVEQAFAIYAAALVAVPDEALVLLEGALTETAAAAAPALSDHLAKLGRRQGDRSEVERRLLVKAMELAGGG